MEKLLDVGAVSDGAWAINGELPDAVPPALRIPPSALPSEIHMVISAHCSYLLLRSIWSQN